ncbi:hypothetical protein PCASD_14949 [Puccinia coronata f. sp. avenae]|uniref:Uncharacterized protein n=1 Tax=Puccinia coronata f. sp. avenae TaxID=200324 RepID=A0A2N5U7B4_9BASI|nr:hypothetical protein PCASD_14949 [Puccinia coronata f. sp. avenae]
MNLEHPEKNPNYKPPATGLNTVTSQEHPKNSDYVHYIGTKAGNSQASARLVATRKGSAMLVINGKSVTL